MTIFISSTAGAFFSFIGAKIINRSIAACQNYTENVDAPVQNQRSFEGVEPNCEDYFHVFCETAADTDPLMQQAPLSCTAKIKTIFSRYLKQIGYTLTTTGGAIFGAALSSSKNQDGSCFLGIYFGCVAMLFGTLAVAQSTIRYRCSDEVSQREIVATYGTCPSTPMSLSPHSQRVLDTYV